MSQLQSAIVGRISRQSPFISLMSDKSIIIAEIRLFVADLSVVFRFWFRQINLHIRLYRQKLPELSEDMTIHVRRVFLIDIEMRRKYVPCTAFAHAGIDF